MEEPEITRSTRHVIWLHVTDRQAPGLGQNFRGEQRWDGLERFHQVPKPFEVKWSEIVSRSVLYDSLRPALDCSLPGFSVHGILQARKPECAAISYSRVSFWPRDWPQKGERGEWKSWLKTQYSKNWDHGFQSHHMANRWEKKWGSKIIVDGDCSLESRRCLLLGRKGKTKPRQCIKKAEASLWQQRSV